MFKTLRAVPMDKRLEFPVAEDCQMGFCIGAALAGDLPICIFPRFNFLLLAISQLVLHLDKLPLMCSAQPRVIIRTAVATDDPLDPGPQHVGDFTDAFRSMLLSVAVVRLTTAALIVPCYEQALRRDGSTILVEFSRLYA